MLFNTDNKSLNNVILNYLMENEFEALKVHSFFNTFHNNQKSCLTNFSKSIMLCWILLNFCNKTLHFLRNTLKKYTHIFPVDKLKYTIRFVPAKA